MVAVVEAVHALTREDKTCFHIQQQYPDLQLTIRPLLHNEEVSTCAAKPLFSAGKC